MEKATLGFCIYKTWQILKRFAETFRRAQSLKLEGVIIARPPYIVQSETCNFSHI